MRTSYQYRASAASILHNQSGIDFVFFPTFGESGYTLKSTVYTVNTVPVQVAPDSSRSTLPRIDTWGPPLDRVLNPDLQTRTYCGKTHTNFVKNGAMIHTCDLP